MGGKLTVLTSGSDDRVKAAAPSCGGISDRYSSNSLHLSTVSDPPSLHKISCPIVFLSPANDFHGRINDLPSTISEIRSAEWRVTCSPHHNHQDTPPYGSRAIVVRSTPENPFAFQKVQKFSLALIQAMTLWAVEVDESRPVLSIDVFYSQQGQMDGKKDVYQNTKNRFWHHTVTQKKWKARLPIFRLKNHFEVQMFGTN